MAKGRNICVEAAKGINGACVCRKYEDAETAYLRYGVVHQRDSRLRDSSHEHPHGLALHTYKDLCRGAGARKIGTTTLSGVEDDMSKMNGDYGDLPPVDEGDMGAFDIKDLIPQKDEIMNMVKAGGGVLGAILVGDQVIPRIPWVKDQNVYIKSGVKLALAVVAGKLTMRYVDGMFGAGLSAGLAGTAIYDVVDHLVFGGAKASAMPELPATTTAAETKAATAGYGAQEDQLFLGDDEVEADEDSDEGAWEGLGANVEQQLFGDVNVVTPGDEMGLGEVSVESQGEVGSFLY